MKLHASAKMSMKGISLVIASAAVLIGTGSIVLFSLSNPDSLLASATGDYRSAGSGNWNAAASWEKFNGTAWVAASVSPNSSDGAINIRSGHTITVSANVTSDELTVDAGATLIVGNGKNLTIAAGSGTDYTVTGTCTINGTLTTALLTSMEVYGTVTLKNGGAHNMASTAVITIKNGGRYKSEDASMTVSSLHWTVESGGVYQHNLDGATLPVADWQAGSTCEVTGVVSTRPNGLNQAFHHFTYNCPNQTSTESFAGTLTDVNGNLTFGSTGTGKVRLAEGETYILNVDGNLNFQGGTVFISCKTDPAVNIDGDLNISGGQFSGTDATKDQGKGSPSITLDGNLNISGGTFDCNQYTANGSGNGATVLNLYGNYTQTGGTITELSTNGGLGRIYFAKTGLQLFSKTGGTISNAVHFTVNNGAILQLGSSIITGDGSFTLSSGAGILLGDANGITQSASSGNIQLTGSRNYDTNADYTFNGSSVQATGDGLPATVRNLTFSNLNDLTLTNSTKVSGSLTMISGNIIVSADTLTLGTSTANTGVLSYSSGQIAGYFKRWIAASATGNILFPVGVAGYYEGVNLSYTVAPATGGSVKMLYQATDPGTSGLPINDAGENLNRIGYSLWSVSSGNGLSGGTFSFDVTATALATVTDPTRLHLLRRPNSSAAWTAHGTHSPGTGSVSVPIIHRTGMTSFGEFGVASNVVNPLPVQLISFTVQKEDDKVLLHWSTASEINNQFFSIERSSDGLVFEVIHQTEGAGNSTTLKTYSAVDREPLVGMNYYRLKQTDFDGKFSYSQIESVNYNEKLAEELKIISVAPNPFSENFVLNFISAVESEIDFMILNSAGQTVLREKIKAIQGVNSYEFSNKFQFTRGIYYINLFYKGQKITQKVIKN